MAVIGVDLDGVLYDFAKACHLAFGRDDNYDPNHGFEFYEDWGLSRGEYETMANAAVLFADLFDRHHCASVSNVRAIKNLLAEGHTVRFVTNRTVWRAQAAVRDQSLRWLERWFGKWDVDVRWSLHIVQDKTQIRTDYFIDDLFENVRALRVAGSEAYLLRRPWNENSEIPSTWQVDTVAEFASIVEPPVEAPAPAGPEPITTWAEAETGLLQAADKIVNGDRQRTYGHPSEHHTRTAKLWSAYLQAEVRPQDVSICMILDKVSRMRGKNKPDNAVDLAGYAAVHGMVMAAVERGEA